MCPPIDVACPPYRVERDVNIVIVWGGIYSLAYCDLLPRGVFAWLSGGPDEGLLDNLVLNRLLPEVAVADLAYIASGSCFSTAWSVYCHWCTCN